MNGQLLPDACHAVYQYYIISGVFGLSLLAKRLIGLFPSSGHLINFGDDIAAIFAQILFREFYSLVGLAHTSQVIHL